MKTLYLHVGTHKTGSTSIQQMLADNAAYLNKNNFCYPALKSSFKRVNKSIPLINGTFLLENYKSFNFKYSIYKLKTLFNKFDNLILSEEFISFLIMMPKFKFWKKQSDVFANLIQLKQFCESNKFKLVIIIYLRRQDDFIESRYKDYVKDGVTYDIDHFWPTIKEFLNYYELINKLKQFSNHIYIRNYNHLYKNDVCVDFCNLLKLNNISLNFSRQNNSTHCLNAVYLQQLINKINMPYKTRYKLYDNVFTKKFSELNNFTMLSKNSSKKILKTYHSSNQFLEKTYGIRFNKNFSNCKTLYDTNNIYFKKDLSLFINNLKKYKIKKRLKLKIMKYISSINF